ncbi:uncharacterized protein LOC124156203 [Ischnura elegans]|uniref:uncharacterized protein LOC124156203 n=1 Tax=Ischnura elegans TaxID=197161 RepID=UPI001ED872A7|nr:uncharacterized protein LOC124156203 [Ischnura elegans]
MAAKYVVLALAAFFCISQASAASHVRRSAEGGNNPLEQIMENVRILLAEVSYEVANLVNVDELKALMENKTKELKERTMNVLDEVKRQMETHGSELSRRVNDALQEATDKLKLSIKYMKHDAPFIIAGVREDFSDSFKTAVKTMMTNTGKIASAAGDDVGIFHDVLANVTMSAIEQTLNLVGKFHNDVLAAVSRVTSS